MSEENTAAEPQDDMFPEYPPLLKPAHVAGLLGISRQRVNTLCRQGYLPSVQVSERRRVIPKNKLQRFIETGGYRA